MNRVLGIDTFRFLMALIVVLFHFKYPVPGIASKILPEYLFHGIPPVIIFFIISGFCIHYPYAKGKELKYLSFYIQRLIRIAVPGMMAWVLFRGTIGVQMVVLWSLICELVYYFLYPVVHYASRHNKLIPVLIISFALSFTASIVYTYTHTDYNGLIFRSGNMVTWLIAFPCWVLGVLLANAFVALPVNVGLTFKLRNLYQYRLLIWTLAVLSSFCRFDWGISYCYTMPLFAIAGYFWLKEELIYFNYVHKKENKWLQYGGLISFSIYLMHDYVNHFFIKVYNHKEYLINQPALWMLALVLAFITSVIYYKVVEETSHKLAKYIGGILSLKGL